MPATVTLRQILIELVERYALGRVIPVSSNTTTTFTLTTTGSPELRGPFTGLAIPVGSPVICTVETTGTSALGNRTFVSNWAPSTGVLTVSPAVGDTDVTEIIVLDPEIKDADRLLEAVNRALLNRLGRWELRPLTFVPDGDLQGATVTDYWTAAANGTAAYATAQIFPAGSAAGAFGQVGVSRLVQLTTAGGASTLTGNGIRVPVSTQQRTWYFLTAIRLVSGTGTAEFKVRDNTNSADITLQVMRGNDTNTLTVTALGDFLICEGTLQVPATCAEIAPRLSLSATGMVAQMAPVIMFPEGAVNFPLPNRIESVEQVGNFFTSLALRSPGSFYDMAIWEDPVVHRIHDYGDHRTVTFDSLIIHPLWFEEYVNGSALSAMTDTTTFPLDRIVKWAKAEYELLRMERVSKGHNGTAESQSKVRGAERLAARALRAAQGSGYEPRLKNIVGRR